MPYGTVAHRNVPKQRALFPLPNGQTADRHPVCSSAVWPFFVPVRAVEGKTPSEGGGLARFCARVYNKNQKTPPNE